MEIFFPSLVALLVGVAIAFFVLPRLAPVILISGSAIVLGLALYLHYSRFGRMEYETATWQYNLRKYSSWVILGAILIAAYGFYTMNSGELAAALPSPIASVVQANASPALPSLESPMLGGGFGNVAATVTRRIGSLMRHGRINA